MVFCDKSTQDLLEDKNGPLRPVSTTEGMAEDDQVRKDFKDSRI